MSDRYSSSLLPCVHDDEYRAYGEFGFFGFFGFSAFPENRNVRTDETSDGDRLPSGARDYHSTRIRRIVRRPPARPLERRRRRRVATSRTRIFPVAGTVFYA